MSDLKTLPLRKDETIYPSIITPEYEKICRSENVMRCMIFQCKKAGVTIKHEKFIIAFQKSLKEVERASNYPYLCFDYNPRLTDKFIKRLRINLSDGGQNFSFSKLAKILAKSLGFYSYESLMLLLFMYQSFKKKPWSLEGQIITKPDIHQGRGGSMLSIWVPLRAVNDTSRCSDYSNHHMSVAKIFHDKNDSTTYSIYIPYICLYKGEAFRDFSFDEEDAIAWLISLSILYIGGLERWNNEIKGQRALEKARFRSEKSWEKLIKQIYEKLDMS